MADLLDITPSTACEAIRLSNGTRLVVRGLNPSALASIVSRYPKVTGMFLGGLDVADLQSHIMQFGDAVAPVIAAGNGHVGDKEAERRAENLPLEDQVKLFMSIWGLTFPNGLDSFVKMLAQFNSTGEGAKPVKVRLKKSPFSSQPSSDAASLPTMQ